MFDDKVCEKSYVVRSFLFGVRVLEPQRISIDIEVCDIVDV